MRLGDKAMLKGTLMRAAPLCAALGLLVACNTTGDSTLANAGEMSTRVTGPQADFPILIGEPYAINGVNYTPRDTLNYDEVGYAVSDAGAFGVTGSHHTLPVPSYVEVTSLDTGRTILVRLERRGPMTSNALVALSPAALAQLDAESGVAVRVRRVNPPEEQRAMLRSGEMAPARMDTPMSLVNVLRRELPDPTPAVAEAVADAEEAVEEAMVALEDIPEIADEEPNTDLPALEVAATDRGTGRTTSVAAAPAIEGSFFVQAAAFSTQARANRAAQALDAFVLAGGDFYRVRTGPFATREEAAASLAKVRAAGYDDARILTGG